MRGWNSNLYAEAPKDVKVTREDLVRIGGYLLPAWRPSVLILSCIILVSLLGLLPPYLMREIIDRAIPQRNGVELNWLVAAMIVTPLVSGLLGVWQNYLVTVMSQGVMFDLRNAMYRTLLRQSLRFFTNTKAGDILSRVQNDVGGVQGVVSGTLVSLSTNVFTLVTTLVVIFRLDARLSLVAVGILPFFILPTRRVGQTSRKLSKQSQERLVGTHVVHPGNALGQRLSADAALRRMELRGGSVSGEGRRRARSADPAEQSRALVLHVPHDVRDRRARPSSIWSGATKRSPAGSRSGRLSPLSSISAGSTVPRRRS